MKKITVILLLILTMLPVVVFADGSFPEGMIGTWVKKTNYAGLTKDMDEITIPSHSFDDISGNLNVFAISGDGNVHLLKYKPKLKSFVQYEVYLSTDGTELILQYNGLNSTIGESSIIEIYTRK